MPTHTLPPPQRIIKTALIAGASGSGKTLIAKMFQNAFVLSMDDYFRPPFPINKDGIPEFDDPKAVNITQWRKDYRAVKEAVLQGTTCKLPKYHFKSHEITRYTFNRARYSSIEWIVLEGLFALTPELHLLADLKIFVEAPLERRIYRRISRDTKERAADLRFVLLHSYYTQVSYEKYILPTMKYADLVIPNFEY